MASFYNLSINLLGYPGRNGCQKFCTFDILNLRGAGGEMTDSKRSHGDRERRRAERIKVNFRAHWEGTWAQREGHITDLSAIGCFILTPDLVRPGEPVKLDIQLPQGEIKIEGQVVYKTEEMGFAIEFTAASDEDRKRLAWLIRAEALIAQRRQK